MPISLFLQELTLLVQYATFLTPHSVKIYDIQRSNLHYNQGLYLIESGSYSIEESLDVQKLIRENIKTIYSFVVSDIFFYVFGLTYQKEKKLQDYFLERLVRKRLKGLAVVLKCH